LAGSGDLPGRASQGAQVLPVNIRHTWVEMLGGVPDLFLLSM
jgi:hypothetical protein